MLSKRSIIALVVSVLLFTGCATVAVRGYLDRKCIKVSLFTYILTEMSEYDMDSTCNEPSTIGSYIRQPNGRYAIFQYGLFDHQLKSITPDVELPGSSTASSARLRGRATLPSGWRRLGDPLHSYRAMFVVG